MCRTRSNRIQEYPQATLVDIYPARVQHFAHLRHPHFLSCCSRSLSRRRLTINQPMPVVVTLIRRKFRESGIEYLPKSIAAALICPASKSCLPVLPDSMFRSGSAISLTFGQCCHLTIVPEPCRLLDQRPDPSFVRFMFSSCSLRSQSISSHGTLYSEVSNAHPCPLGRWIIIK